MIKNNTTKKIYQIWKELTEKYEYDFPAKKQLFKNLCNFVLSPPSTRGRLTSF